MRNDFENPGREATRHGAQNIRQAPQIIHPRRDCSNCGTPLQPREFHTCRPCRAYLSLWRALVEMSRIAGGVS